MVSRTMMKQQIMRQMVMDEEKPHRDMTQESNENRNSYKGNWNHISQSNDNLTNLTSTIIPREKNLGYYKHYLDHENRINFKEDINNMNKDDFSFLCSDYYVESDKNNSQYLNMCHQNGLVVQSFNIEQNVDQHGYCTNQLGHLQERYIDKMPLHSPVTVDKSTASTRRISNSNSNKTGLGNDEKSSKSKDRSKKESHNRIERKRRDFINQQIIELCHLLPPQMMTDGESKKNKGNILKNSVVYIRHLQNEAMHSSNYVKETELAFMLVDSYRKQIQELQQQLQSMSEDVGLKPCNYQNLSHAYHEYLITREHNRVAESNSRITSDMFTRLPSSSYNKSPLSPTDNGSAFKVEPRSVQSSVDTNSLSSTNRMDEDVSVGSSSLTPEISQQNNQPIPMA